MAGSKKKIEEEGPNVPAYIVTFSDMVTLLLTFFVMLLSMAQVQDAALFNKSRDAFREYIDCYGMGMLSGKKIVAEMGEVRTRYFIPDSDEDVTARSLDSENETLRRLFREATQSVRKGQSQVDVRASDYAVTDIRFSGRTPVLKESDQSYLKHFADGVKRQARSTKIELYVLGLANDQPAEKNKWITSSLRAQVVARYLKEAGLQCPVYAWGGGSGGHWLKEGSPISKESQIFIAVLRNR